MYIGDIMFQALMIWTIAAPFFFLIGAVSLIRFAKRRNTQLERMEEKLDQLSKLAEQQ